MAPPPNTSRAMNEISGKSSCGQQCQRFNEKPQFCSERPIALRH
ncbi:hypothetical protein RRSWK_02112 [Rhodopirellula sp. SWK7]|nr:hypothetical protein RRSWK_02112 [Rhodopirellula sp. SWK7]